MRAPSYRQFTTLGKTACESSLPESPEIVKHPANQALRGGRRFMFLGHLAVGLAAKGAARKPSLGTYIAAAELPDQGD